METTYESGISGSLRVGVIMVNKEFYNVCWNKSNTIKLLAAHTAYVKVGWKPVNLSSFSNFHAIQSIACLWGPQGNEEHLPRKQVLRSGGYRFLHFHKKKKKTKRKLLNGNERHGL